MFSGIDLSAFRGSAIAAPTIQAYLDTQYRIEEPSALALCIGRRHHGLASLLAGYGLEAAAVVTAWNPYSQRRPRRDNDCAHEALMSEIGRRGLPHFAARGADPEDKWPPERSRLVLGIDLPTAAALGRRFDQNGIVWAGGDGLPLLVLLR